MQVISGVMISTATIWTKFCISVPSVELLIRSESGARLSCFQDSPRVQDGDDSGLERRNSYTLFKLKKTEYNTLSASFLEFPTIVDGSFGNSGVRVHFQNLSDILLKCFAYRTYDTESRQRHPHKVVLWKGLKTQTLALQLVNFVYWPSLRRKHLLKFPLE